MPCCKQYDRLITVEQFSGSADAHGHIDITDNSNWSTYTTAYAKCMTKGGREFWKVDKMEADVSHVWVCPYDTTLAAAAPKMRVKWNSTYFEIVSVINIDLANERIEIQTRQAA